MVIRVRALSRRAQHHDTKSPQPEAAGEAIASDATHGAAVVLGYLEGRQIPERDTLTAALHQLLHQTQKLETRLGELESVERRAVELQRTVELLRADNEQLQLTIRRLEIRFRRHVSERVSPDQLKLALTPAATAAPSDPAGPEPDQGDAEACSSARVGAEPPAQPPPPGSDSDTQPTKKRDRHGRRRIGVIPQVIVETVPRDVLEKGLENFERLGEEDSRTIGWRRGGPVEIVHRRAKFVPRTGPGPDGGNTHDSSTAEESSLRPGDPDGAVFVREHEVASVPQNTAFKANPFIDGAIVCYTPQTSDDSSCDAQVLIAPMHERPIDRCLADPSLLARLLVHKLDYHTPYYRQQIEADRQGFPIARANMARWQYECGAIALQISGAMWNDALTRSWFGMDATGTAIRDKKQLRYGYVFVLVAPGDSVLFRFAPKYNGDTVDELFGGYQATIVADASANHNVLFGPGKNREAGCWSHARKPLVKALAAGEGQPAAFALQLIQSLFRIEQRVALCSPEQRLLVRKQESAPLVEQLFPWAKAQKSLAAEGSFVRAGAVYLVNQELALREFLSNGEIPIHNNASERALRKIVKGRVNWLSHGSDDHAQRSCAISSLITSCELHGLDPEFYLQEILTVAPSWPRSRILELSPKHWVETRQRLIAEGRLKYIDLALVAGSRLTYRTDRP